MRWKPKPVLFERTIPEARWGQPCPIAPRKKWKPKDE
jgi:hypothetical protein